MSMREEIIQNYNDLCEAFGEELTRDKYRKFGNYKTSLIDKVFGSWKEFQAELNHQITVGRGTQIITQETSNERVLITSVVDGTEINWNFWNTLKYYAKKNGCDLYVLWGKSIKNGKYFDEETFTELKKYLVTDLSFLLDSRCVAKDLFIPYSQKNPLINLDKLSNKLTTVIVGSPKQYLKTLPYDYNDAYKLAWSTGTISNIDYGPTIAAQLDCQHNTLGALFLEYNSDAGRYNVRNLIYKDDCMIDLNNMYTENHVTKIKSVPAMVMGDLHLPEEDEQSVHILRSAAFEFLEEHVPHPFFSFLYIHCFQCLLSVFRCILPLMKYRIHCVSVRKGYGQISDYRADPFLRVSALR